MTATLYILAAAAGLGYAALSFALGTLGGDGDGGGGHGHAHGDGGHDGDAGDADADAGEGLPLRSPTVLAAAAAGFGFGGIGLAALGLPPAAHLAGALATGLGLALGVAVFLARGVRGMDATTSASPADFEGAEAEVTTPIPAGGLGEIALEHAGLRYTGPARAAGPCARGARVLVVRARPDGVYDVSPLPRFAASGHAAPEEE
ncbi:MAG: hypothetical protein U0229_07700 [Anaeromyxobacter sp.]